MSKVSLSPVALGQSFLNSFRGVRYHSAELTCEPVWAKVRQRYFDDEACDPFCAVQALRLTLTSLPLQGATRHTFPEQHKVQRLHPQVIVRRMMCCQARASSKWPERMTKDMTASASTTLKIMVVASPDGESSLLAPNASIAQKCCRQRLVFTVLRTVVNSDFVYSIDSMIFVCSLLK